MRMNIKLSSEYNILVILLFILLLICMILHYLFPKLNPQSVRQDFLLSYLPGFLGTKKCPDGVKLRNYEEEGAKGSEECSVCLCEIKQGDEIMQLPCHHLFHALCLNKWLVSYGQFTCPFCRASLSPPSSSSSSTSTVVYSESGVEVISYNFFSSSGSRRRNSWGLM